MGKREGSRSGTGSGVSGVAGRAGGSEAGVLGRLGFTPLESVIYAFLVKAGPATGYRIAQAVGKPVGNVYKAVEGLEDKGAVMTSEEDATRLVRAVGVREVVSRLRSEVWEACEEAVERLDAGVAEVVDDHVYRIGHTGQFLRRAAAMLESATGFVILTATPGVLASKAGRGGDAGDGGGEETLAGLIARASERIRVACKVFAHVQLGRAEVVVDPRGVGALETGPGEWLVLTCDGREVLTGLFDGRTGELHMGQWTENPLLSWAMYSGMSSDLVLAAVRRACGEDGAGAMAAGRLVEGVGARLSVFESPASAGKNRLKQRFRSPARGKRRADGGE